MTADKSGIQQGGPLSRSRKAAERAERNRCPKSQRKSALSIAVYPGQVVSYCRWNDCDYESATDLNP